MRLVAKPQVREGGVWQPSSRPQVARRKWRNSRRRKISRTSRFKESVGSCIRRVSNSSKVRSSAPSLYKFATSPVPGGGVLGCSDGPTELSAKLLSPMSIHHRPVEVVGVKVFGKSTSSTFYVKRYLQVFCSAFRLWSEGALRDIYRLQTFPALGHLVGHLLALFEGFKSAACYPRVVHEHIFATILWSDEAKALLVGKPLDRSLGHLPRTLPFFS